MIFGDIEIEKGKETTLKGVVVFFDFAVGSKSESKQPYLYLNSGSKVRLYKPGDQMFENESLVPFDGKQVTVIGKLGREEIFEIAEICMAAEEAKATEVDTPVVIEDSKKTEGSEVQ